MARAITRLFGGGRREPEIIPAPPPPKPKDEPVIKAGEDERAIRRRRGRGSTILTGTGLFLPEPVIERPKLGGA